MTILAADKIADVGGEDLRDARHTCIVEPTLSGDAFVDVLPSECPNAMIGWSTR